MSADLNQQIQELQAENQKLREQLEQKTKVAVLALASYQQRALHMETVRQQNEDLQKDNQNLRQQLEQKTKVATRALASYQQRALHMEIIRQQNEDLDRLTKDLGQAKQLVEERVREGEALLIEVQRLAAIVENHPDFIGVGTLEGQALYLNPAGLKLMGLDRDHDVTQMRTENFYPAEDAKRLLQEGLPAALAQGTWSGTANLLKVDGTAVPVEQTIGINYDADGRPYSFSVTMRDITERQKAEAEREKLLADVQAAYNQYLRQEWGQYLDRRHQGELEIVHRRRMVEEGHDQARSLSNFESEISLRGQRLGVLNLEDVEPNRHWTDEEIALIETVSEQLAQTAENLRLFEETRERAGREQAIREITEKMRASSSLEELVKTAAEALGQRFSAELALVELGIDTPAEHAQQGSNGHDQGDKGEQAN
jgi:PAS domain S-box-containing protein